MYLAPSLEIGMEVTLFESHQGLRHRKSILHGILLWLCLRADRWTTYRPTVQVWRHAIRHC